MNIDIAVEEAHFITLPNGLRAMLCHQPDLTTSYISMSVRAGHFYDPDICPGLSHLLEHMLFMGSRHFPNPNAVNDFIEQYGGSINAWTGTEYTNFHYQCDGTAINQTLPAFADMLRQPVLNEESIANEIKSIDAEYKFKKRDDLRRLYQIHKETCNPAHPFSKFSVGNAAVFSEHGVTYLRETLRAFHTTYYCAQNMCLCIASPVPLKQLEAIVFQSFSNFTQGQRANDKWPPLYEKAQLGIKINIKPLQTARRLIATFTLPAIHNDIKTKPLNYISHLLGDEGEGSLLAYLKGKNWAMNLIAGSGIEGDHFKDFNISFQLTKRGMEHTDEILHALFSYIELIKSSIDEPWRFKEKAQLTSLAMTYEENIKPLNLICEYAQAQFFYSPDDIRLLRKTVGEYNQETLNHAMGFFTPDYLRVKVISPDSRTTTACAFYDAEYGVEPMDKHLLLSLAKPAPMADLALPPPNPYIGEQNGLVLPEQGCDLPQKILSGNGVNVWFAQDQQFYSPKGDIYVSFDCVAFSDSLEAVAAKRIWLSALNDHLQAKYYRAEIAGLHYRIYGHQAGFTIHTRGFANQQPLLLKQLLDAVFEYVPTESCFEHYQQTQEQNLQNALMNKPTNRLFSRLSVLIQQNTQAPVELLDATRQVSFNTMCHLRDIALNNYFIESFIHGNWTCSDANDIASMLTTTCSKSNGAPLSRAVCKLPTKSTLFHQVDCNHEDAAVVLYLQAPSQSVEEIAQCMVLEQMLAAPFFNALRTEQQLGYVVGTGYVPHNQHPGIAFYVQSPDYGPTPILEAITTFLFQQLEEIDFYRFYWPTIQKNLLKQLEERDLTLSMKSQRLWVSLGTHDLAFDRNIKLAECIASLTFERIQEYAHALAERTHCGELILFSEGKHEPISSVAEQTITSISEFKRQASYFA